MSLLLLEILQEGIQHIQVSLLAGIIGVVVPVQATYGQQVSRSRGGCGLFVLCHHFLVQLGQVRVPARIQIRHLLGTDLLDAHLLPQLDVNRLGGVGLLVTRQAVVNRVVDLEPRQTPTILHRGVQLGIQIRIRSLFVPVTGLVTGDRVAKRLCLGLRLRKVLRMHLHIREGIPHRRHSCPQEQRRGGGHGPRLLPTNDSFASNLGRQQAGLHGRLTDQLQRQSIRNGKAQDVVSKQW